MSHAVSSYKKWQRQKISTPTEVNFRNLCGRTLIGSAKGALIMPKTATTRGSQTSAKKKTAKKRKRASLLSCPVNGAGWCPYPFSIEQLEKRLKEKALAQAGAAK